MAFEPGWGHCELFGVCRFFRNRIYPNAPASAAGAFNDSVFGGGVGGGFRVPFANKKLSIGLKGLYGNGTGRNGSSTIADLTFRSDGTISLLHTWSALGTIELTPISPLTIYLNYGADYVGRDIQSGGLSGYGLPTANMTGCNTEGLPGGSFSPSGTGTCAGNNKDTQEAVAGFWYNFYDGPRAASGWASSTAAGSAICGRAPAGRPIPAATPGVSTICSGPRFVITCRSVNCLPTPPDVRSLKGGHPTRRNRHYELRRARPTGSPGSRTTEGS